ncbi:transposable element Tc1 transposase [Trichonephila clavipes]|nr:transposable element Tc1 transposase [Trichonephila clavipes]
MKGAGFELITSNCPSLKEVVSFWIERGSPDGHRRRVWRRLGQRSDPAFTIARYTGPQPGVMVWCAISFDSRSPLVIIRGTLTAQLCFDDILRTVLLPFLLQYLGLIFQKIRPDHLRHMLQ